LLGCDEVRDWQAIIKVREIGEMIKAIIGNQMCGECHE